MAENGDQDGQDVPDVVVSRGRGFSLIWIVPIVAAVVGATLAYNAIQSRGIEIVIHFESAEWLEAGKTKLRYRNVEIGTVDEIRVSTGLEGVDIHCTLVQEVAGHLGPDAVFWIVHPRVGAEGISGLGTLLSGAYIAHRPSAGEMQKRFTGLENPPGKPRDAPGLKLVLHSERLESLQPGSPIYYRDVHVGEVDGYQMLKDGSGVELTLYFAPEHAKLVRQNSRFWNVGGISLSMEMGHVDVQTASLASLLMGGIAFDSPHADASPQAKEGSEYWLHPSRSAVTDYPFKYGGLRVVVEGDHIGSLSEGDFVYYREVPIGSVISKALSNDATQVRAQLNIRKRYTSLVRDNSVFFNTSGITADLGLTGIHIHAESLKSLLSGGIALATPNEPGTRVTDGSVFMLHSEVRNKWLAWSPEIRVGPLGESQQIVDAAKSKEGPALFFHHKGKTEEIAKKDAAAHAAKTEEPAHEEKRHGFFRGFFGKDG